MAEASRRAPRITARGDSRLLDEGAAPTFADLAGALQFALGDSRIWLSNEPPTAMLRRSASTSPQGCPRPRPPMPPMTF